MRSIVTRRRSLLTYFYRVISRERGSTLILLREVQGARHSLSARASSLRCSRSLLGRVVRVGRAVTTGVAGQGRGLLSCSQRHRTIRGSRSATGRQAHDLKRRQGLTGDRASTLSTRKRCRECGRVLGISVPHCLLLAKGLLRPIVSSLNHFRQTFCRRR